MKVVHILFVEDEPAQQDRFETAIAEWNASDAADGRQFKIHNAPFVEDAEEALDRMRFDAALFDLRVKTRAKPDKKAEPAGNGLALKAMHECGIPVAIMTADDTVLDPDVRKAGKVEVFDKNAKRNATGGAYENAVAWFASLWGMMKVMDAARRRIDSSAADIFLRRLWPKWETFSELQTADKRELTDIVTRQYVGHIAELLGLDGPDGTGWHPFENYVHPSLIEDRAHTGDIFEFDNEFWVVLTPQCDMAVGKVPNVILAECVPGVKGWKDNIEALRVATSKTKRRDPLEFLEGLVNQNLPPSQHFLPPLPGSDEPLLVMFRSVKMVPMKELNELLGRRVASISSPFLSNIVQRFGSYLSRMGQPNINVDHFT